MDSVHQSQKYIVSDISAFLEVTTSCQFRPAQQQNTIWTRFWRTAEVIAEIFRATIISPNQVFTSLLKTKSDILLIKNKTKPNLTAFFN